MSALNANVCVYPNCSLRFASLHELIVHVEAVHIDFYRNSSEDNDGVPLENVPFSFILPYCSEEELLTARYENAIQGSWSCKAAEVNDNLESCNYNPMDNSYAYNHSFYGDPWFGSNDTKVAVQQNCEIVEEPLVQSLNTKRFPCPVEGCTKSYKNQNGMKYHVTNYHDINNSGNVKPKKNYTCNYCDKKYKTIRGLQAHIAIHEENVAGLAHPINQSLHIQSQAQMKPNNLLGRARNSPLFKPSVIQKDIYFSNSSALTSTTSSSTTTSVAHMMNEHPYHRPRQHSFLEMEQTPHLFMQQLASNQTPLLSSSMVPHKKSNNQSRQQSFEDYYNLNTAPSMTRQLSYETTQYQAHFADESQNIAQFTKRTRAVEMRKSGESLMQIDEAGSFISMNSMYNQNVMYMGQTMPEMHVNQHLLTCMQHIQDSYTTPTRYRPNILHSSGETFSNLKLEPVLTNDPYFDQQSVSDLTCSDTIHSDVETHVTSL